MKTAILILSLLAACGAPATSTPDGAASPDSASGPDAYPCGGYCLVVLDSCDDATGNCRCQGDGGASCNFHEVPPDAAPADAAPSCASLGCVNGALCNSLGECWCPTDGGSAQRCDQ
jgi:hypothetical protein